MRATEAVDKVRELAATYFSGANVIYGNQSRTAKPELNLVTILGGAVRRSTHPIKTPIDCEPVNCFKCRVSVTVDLFSHGKPVVVDDIEVAKENTAVEDLLSFVDFLDSDYALEWCNRNDLTILMEGDAQNLTGIINQTTYEYRARIQLSVYFTEYAVGSTGVWLESSIVDGEIHPVYKQTPSGGGSQPLADVTADYFESVEVTEAKEELANE